MVALKRQPRVSAAASALLNHALLLLGLIVKGANLFGNDKILAPIAASTRALAL
jgi:hypothetical protein